MKCVDILRSFLSSFVALLCAPGTNYTACTLCVTHDFFVTSLYRNGWNGTACCLVIANDILDHVDGIVAKVQREQYGQIDDPMFGGFIDAFCDKVLVLLV